MELQSKIMKVMEAKGYLVLKIIRLNENGYPDLLCIREQNIWIEVKSKNDTLKPLQKFRIDELNKIGNIAFCVKEENIIYPFKMPFTEYLTDKI